MKGQHQIFQELSEHGYAGIDEGSKFRILNCGIKTDKLNNVKPQILADANLCNDFDACVTLYKDFLTQFKSEGNSNDTLNISQVHTGGSNSEKKARFGNKTWKKGKWGKAAKRKRDDDDIDDVEDCYYSSKEYGKIGPAAKEKLKKLCDGRNRQVSSVTSEVKEMKLQIAQLTATLESSDGNDTEDTPDQGSNRTNSALRRAGTCKGGRD